MGAEAVQAEILGLAREECAEHCKLAQVKARQAAGFVIRGVSSLEEVKIGYSSAVKDCTGPKEIEVCGATDDEKTYECRVLGKLVSLQFDQTEL
jgi:hypothetical protein